MVPHRPVFSGPDNRWTGDRVPLYPRDMEYVARPGSRTCAGLWDRYWLPLETREMTSRFQRSMNMRWGTMLHLDPDQHNEPLEVPHSASHHCRHRESRHWSSADHIIAESEERLRYEEWLIWRKTNLTPTWRTTGWLWRFFRRMRNTILNYFTWNWWVAIISLRLWFVMIIIWPYLLL